jgi:hypothetical protein
MRKTVVIAASVLGLSALPLMPANAMPIGNGVDTPSLTIQVADGCGPGRYRGPGGACHVYGRGPFPGGYYTNSRWNGCPPGSWRGPWGHCRNTPYHGRLPGGGWK